jgi:Zn-dependent peptidase ImmA (M78 family)
MLKEILSFAKLDASACAELLGISPTIFEEWVAGKRQIPESFVPTLSTVLGVDQQMFSTIRAKKSAVTGELMPAVWFKFRGEALTNSDRECVLLIRQLAHFLNELEQVTDEQSVAWRTSFENILRNIDHQSPPREQGRHAARLFRQERGLAHGAMGIGDSIRKYLRTLGVLVVETSVPESTLEGCCFYVGQRPQDRPCIFANTYNTNWFRRNMVLAHELAHAIFDALGEGASIDFKDQDSIGNSSITDVQEQRAQAFAQECLVPRDVLRHIAQTCGLKWGGLGAPDLALLVARLHVELKTVVAAAVEAELVTPEIGAEYLRTEYHGNLKQISQHALSTQEFLARIGPEQAAPFTGKRTTTLPRRKILLPVGYVDRVIRACQGEQISLSRAAQMLMVDRDTFHERFPTLCEAFECE